MAFGTSNNREQDNSDDVEYNQLGTFNPKKEKETKSLKMQKLPGHASELLFVMVNMFLLKFHSQMFFDAMTFFILAVPMLIYLVVTLFTNLMQFIKLLHIEEISGSLTEEESSQIISPQQQKLLTRIFRDLCAYFGIYYLSQQLDKLFVLKDEMLEKVQGDPQFLASILFMEVALIIQVCIMRNKRKQILQAQLAAGMIDEATANQSIFSVAGLSTVFNALTQTTTTLCANGQCFTIYSNTIASNLAAFGVTVTSISTILIPICCCLLTYSVWCLYKERKDCCYKPFLLGLVGSLMIVFDNFLFGEALNLHNIPSWIGNASLIIASLWAAKDNSKDQASPFGF